MYKNKYYLYVNSRKKTYEKLINALIFYGVIK